MNKNKPLFFDNHAHLNFAAYEEDRREVVERTLSEGVWTVNVGTNLKTSTDAVSLSVKYDEGVYATVGLHPIHTSKSYHDIEELGGEGKAFTSSGETFDAESYLAIAKEEKVLGIGETGLDYYRLDEDTSKTQREAFIGQIEVANKVNKPLMLHIRPGAKGDAYGDAYEILKSESKVGADIHFFAGTVAQARRFLDLGYYLSFTGVITFAKEYRELVEFIPLESILSETDCPYVTPVPHRGKRNEPLFVKEVVKSIADIKKIDIEKAKDALVQNSFKFWKFDSQS